MSLDKLIVAGGGSLKNKTGKWAVKQAEIDQKKCIKCHQCVLVCPESCIEIERDGRNVFIDKDYCKGCATCAVECPVKAIKIKQNG